jgi:hypothetical protein
MQANQYEDLNATSVGLLTHISTIWLIRKKKKKMDAQRNFGVVDSGIMNVNAKKGRF